MNTDNTLSALNNGALQLLIQNPLWLSNFQKQLLSLLCKNIPSSPTGHICIPTNADKLQTSLALAIAYQYAYPNKKSLLIVPNDTALQAYQNLYAQIALELNFPLNNIIIAKYASSSALSADLFGLVLADDARLSLTTPNLSKIKNKFNHTVIFDITATPLEWHKKQLKTAFDTPLLRINISDSVQNHLLPSVTNMLLETKFPIDLTNTLWTDKNIDEINKIFQEQNASDPQINTSEIFYDRIAQNIADFYLNYQDISDGTILNTQKCFINCHRADVAEKQAFLLNQKAGKNIAACWDPSIINQESVWTDFETGKLKVLCLTDNLHKLPNINNIYWMINYPTTTYFALKQCETLLNQPITNSQKIRIVDIALANPYTSENNPVASAHLNRQILFGDIIHAPELITLKQRTIDKIRQKKSNIVSKAEVSDFIVYANSQELNRVWANKPFQFNASQAYNLPQSTIWSSYKVAKLLHNFQLTSEIKHNLQVFYENGETFIDSTGEKRPLVYHVKLHGKNNYYLHGNVAALQHFLSLCKTPLKINPLYLDYLFRNEEIESKQAGMKTCETLCSYFRVYHNRSVMRKKMLELFNKNATFIDNDGQEKPLIVRRSFGSGVTVYLNAGEQAIKTFYELSQKDINLSFDSQLKPGRLGMKSAAKIATMLKRPEMKSIFQELYDSRVMFTDSCGIKQPIIELCYFRGIAPMLYMHEDKEALRTVLHKYAQQLNISTDAIDDTVAYIYASPRKGMKSATDLCALLNNTKYYLKIEELFNHLYTKKITFKDSNGTTKPLVEKFNVDQKDVFYLNENKKALKLLILKYGDKIGLRISQPLSVNHKNLNISAQQNKEKYRD